MSKRKPSTYDLASLLTLSLLDFLAFYARNSLLTVDNTKFKKSSNDIWIQVGLTLAPWLESLKWNMCRFASAGCRMACLNSAGRQKFTRNVFSRVKRTVFFMRYRRAFLDVLTGELFREYYQARAAGKRLAIRLNTLSDLVWEKLAPWLFTMLSDCQFIDYTKDVKRYMRFLKGKLPANYHLTLSRTEDNWKACEKALKAGGTVACVVRDAMVKDYFMATGYRGFPCVDGDSHDRRWEDPKGYCVLLTAKGLATKDKTGFVIDRA